MNIVINCAASVDFNARLDESLQINVFGTFNMFKLAQNFQRLENFIHVSTTYVNSDKKGFIEEKIYDHKFPVDPYSFAKQLLTLKVEELPQKLEKILGNYPNTYTFTKFISEHVLKDKRP